MAAPEGAVLPEDAEAREGTVADESAAAKRKAQSGAAPWQVYLLRCADGTLYTGVARDLSRRLRQHNGELVGGAAYTRSRRPVTLLWQDSCINRSDAQRREAEIKRLTRSEKLRLSRSPKPPAVPGS